MILQRVDTMGQQHGLSLIHISPAHENWKHYARRATTTAAELGPRIALHAELDAVRYACPSCARLLDVEIKLKNEEPLFDFEISH